MKFNLKRRLCVLTLCAVLLLGLFSVGVSASDGDLVTWSFDLYSKTMTRSDGKTFYQYDYNGQFDIDPISVYRYKTPCDLGYVSAASPFSEVIWIEGNNGYIHIYATDTGYSEIQRYLNGNGTVCKLRDTSGTYAAKIDTDTVELLNASGKDVLASTVTVDVREIENAQRYELYVCDASETFSYLNGVIYADSNGSLYYLNYLTLGNQHFDADGNFSYRQGTVELVVLDKSTAATVAISIDNMEEEETQYTVEGDGAFGSDEENSFLGFCIFVGILLPVPFLVIGLTLPTSKKRGYPKYWYILAAIAAAWILLSVILMILLSV